MKINKTIVAVATISALSINAAQAATALPGHNIQGMVSFGDSLSDSGNVHAATGFGIFSAPYAGVNSDGPVWTQQVADAYGVGPHTGSLTGGTGYAYAGARASIDGDVPSVQSQVDSYLALTGGIADPNTLYTVWGGANDALYAAAVGDYSSVPIAAGTIASIADELMNAGASSVLIMNLPNIGYTPRQNWDPAQAAGGDFISASYNTALSAAVGAIQGGRDIQIFDAYTWTSDLVNNLPAGMNGVDACIVDAELSASNGQSPGMCSDPSNYLWWDSIHPTTAGYALLTDDVIETINQLDVATVPVPAAAWLFISGLAGLIGAKKARK